MAINSVKFIRKSQLKNIELRYSHYRQRAFDKHTHDVYSVGVVKEGQTEFWCHNQAETIKGGEIALINPGEVHACNPEKGSALTYYMLYIEPDFIRDISFAMSEKGAKVAEFTAPIVRNGLLFRSLTGLCLAIEKAQTILEIEVVLYEILAEIIQKYGNIKTRKAKHTQGAGQAVENGRDYLMDNLFQNVSLQELANYSGLSPFHFLREFRKCYGLPPHTYQLQQRVNVAKRLLANDQPIAHVAMEVGFADQSHFTRKFKSFVGATPRQYQMNNC